ncbi:MAG: translation initiation factor IF-2, partial [Simkaniaceae bacterium]|nr:translation initiation factor IF-2 [Simkaniaceae bacterium]
RNVNRDEPVIRPTELSIRLPITVKELASEMKYKASELISKLFKQGIPLTINDMLDDETTVQLLGDEFGCVIKIDTSQEERLRITGKSISEEIKEQPEEGLISRAPVIAFMGHVDHGKTSLIDSIRKSDLAADEAGAITQHIGAFRCNVSNGELTVLDTPGHEAFTEMRSRGANVTDVVILVVAGDEGIKPQTDEAINQAKEAGVPIVVAINKCDKEGFDTDQIYRQLSERELLPEAWGGGTITVNCSAKTGEGIETLLELALLQAEVLELRANPNMRARGTVLESSIHQGLGNVSTILVQNGTLKINDALVFENEYGRIKTMHDEHGKPMKKAGPSQPVRITGLSGQPSAGCEFIVVANEKEARKLAEDREAGHKRSKLVHIKQEQIDAMLLRSQQLAEKKILRIIVRADVQGSLEALLDSLAKIKSDKVELNIISAEVGQISESDIELASASNTPIVAFHTSTGPGIDEMAKKLKVKVIPHDVIYHLIDEVKVLMAETLDKVRQETEAGVAEVKTTFKSSHLGVIAGCVVATGSIKRGQFARLFRGEQQVWEGEIDSLKRVKEDVKEVVKGLECGIVLKNFMEIEENDEIKTYDVTFIKQEL